MIRCVLLFYLLTWAGVIAGGSPGGIAGFFVAAVFVMPILVAGAQIKANRP
jgi:hypothetical protein